jgi:DNA polymerase III gamma/tau subunit
VIAEASDGSFRDGIKILEQLIAEEKELTQEFITCVIDSTLNLEIEPYNNEILVANNIASKSQQSSG